MTSMFHYSSDKQQHNIPPSLLPSIDAILVLGGGVPSSPTEPPIYVQHRCDAAAQIYQTITTSPNSTISNEGPFILCLSAGTAHLPQFIHPTNGLPIWEATASAGYLFEKRNNSIPKSKVLVETTSYDTIGNAYFARVGHVDVAGWTTLLIVTNEFHMDRTKAIFDWIFRVPNTNADSSASPPHRHSPQLYYLSCDNIGLSSEAVRVRKEHERKGERNVKEHLSVKYTTLKDVWKFLTMEHTFYCAEKLVQKGMEEKQQGSSDGGGGLKVEEEDQSSNDGDQLKDSYGRKSTK